MSESSADKSFAARLTTAQRTAHHTPIRVVTTPRHSRTSSPLYVSDLSYDKQCFNKRCVHNSTLRLILLVVIFNLFVSILLFQLKIAAYNQMPINKSQEASIGNTLFNRLAVFSNSKLTPNLENSTTELIFNRSEPQAGSIVVAENEKGQEEILLNSGNIIENSTFFPVDMSMKYGDIQRTFGHKNLALESTTQETIFLHEKFDTKQNDLWISYEGVPIQQPFYEKFQNLRNKPHQPNNEVLIQKKISGKAVLIIDCLNELDEKGTTLCKQWRLAGFCESHPATKYLFCRRECICKNQGIAET